MGNGRQVLLVDNDAIMLQMLAEQLQFHEEFIVSTAKTSDEALEAAGKDCFGVIILNMAPPDLDGCQVCRLMRQSGVKCPIIMLAQAGVDPRATLDAGVDDCIIKPFRLELLLARVRVFLRCRQRDDDAIFSIGSYTFQPGDKLLFDKKAGKKIRLTDKEAAILEYLRRIGDQAVGREVLLDKIWGYNAGVTTHTLETHIYRLRQKIERDPSDAMLLITEPGGYRLAPSKARG